MLCSKHSNTLASKLRTNTWIRYVPNNNSARLTLERASGQVTFTFQMLSHIWGRRIIGERLDFLLKCPVCPWHSVTLISSFLTPIESRSPPVSAFGCWPVTGDSSCQSSLLLVQCSPACYPESNSSSDQQLTPPVNCGCALLHNHCLGLCSKGTLLFAVDLLPVAGHVNCPRLIFPLCSVLELGNPWSKRICFFICED